MHAPTLIEGRESRHGRSLLRDGFATWRSSDGEPGLRPKYDANYYCAFVRDPDGHKLEVVTYSAR